MRILQLRQSQIPDLPFEIGRGFGTAEFKITDHEGRYLMVPTNIMLAEGGGELFELYNAMIAMSRMRGFTHLMLIYGG